MMATYIGKEKRDQEYYGLGQANLELGKKKMAITMFKKAFNENRNNHKAKYQVATLSEDFFKDKKIAYKHYEDYVNLFEKNDSLLTDFAKTRIKVIKKFYFQKGEILE